MNIIWLHRTKLTTAKQDYPHEKNQHFLKNKRRKRMVQQSKNKRNIQTWELQSLFQHVGVIYAKLYSKPDRSYPQLIFN